MSRNHFFFIAVIGFFLPITAFTKNSDEEKVEQWNNIREIAIVNKPLACQEFLQLPWVEKFEHQDLIEFKKREYCRTPPDVSEKDPRGLLRLARFQREEYQYEEAKKNIKKALKLVKFKDIKIDLLEEKLKLDQIEQNKEERLKTLEKLSQLDSEKFTVDYARILWTYGKTSRAVEVLKKADKKWKKKVSRQPLYFVLARIHEEQKKLKLAQTYFEKALKQSIQDDEYYKNLLAMYGWFSFKKGQYEKAISLFEKMTPLFVERFNLSRAQFWTAQALGRLKKPEEAQKIYEKLIQEDPMSYYSLISYRELGRPLPPLEFSSTTEKRKLKDHPDVSSPLADKWSWAEKFGEKVFLESLANQMTVNFYKQKEKDQRLLLYYFWEAGLSNFLTRLLSLAPSETRISTYQKYLFYLFPMPYFDHVKAESDKIKLDPFLVMSLIRQESGFNPMARSPTDALGLMQLMPKVARRIAGQNKIELKTDLELLEPTKNIRLGVLELSERLKEFKNHRVLAVASYNAGSDPVKIWKKSRKRKNILEFIEEIPYEETRSYVRLILRNQIIYTQLQAKKEFPFPEEWLKPL